MGLCRAVNLLGCFAFEIIFKADAIQIFTLITVVITSC